MYTVFACLQCGFNRASPCGTPLIANQTMVGDFDSINHLRAA